MSSEKPEVEVEGLQEKGITIKGLMAKFTSDGLAVCGICGQAFHDLEPHLGESHQMTVLQYQEKFPGYPIKAEDGAIQGKLSYKERPPKQFSVFQEFGFYWSKGKKDKMVQGYEVPGPLTPPIDEGYVFPPEETQVLLLALHLKNKVLISGPTGTGKSSLVEQIAAHLNYNLVRINFDAGLTRADLVGQWIVKGREMEFLYGILPRGMAMSGSIVLFDEWDSMSEDCSFVLQRPLERNSQLLIMEKGEEIVRLHPDNMIVSTANTVGMGDDSGLYKTGTRVQNYAQINRYEMTIILDYLPPDQEAQVLTKRFPKIEPWEAEAIIQGINAVRDAYMKGTCSAPLSTRDAINWAEKFTIWGDPMKAAKYCFINRAPLEERGVLEGVVKRCFPKE